MSLIPESFANGLSFCLEITRARVFAHFVLLLMAGLALTTPTIASAGAEMNAVCVASSQNKANECTVHPIFDPDWRFGFPGAPMAQCGVLPCSWPDEPQPFPDENGAVDFKKTQIAQSLPSGTLCGAITATATSEWYHQAYDGFEYHTHLANELRDWKFDFSVKPIGEPNCIADTRYDTVSKVRHASCDHYSTQGIFAGWVLDPFDSDTYFCKRPLANTCPVNNPVYADRGERRQSEIDITFGGGLSFERVYRSNSQVAAPATTYSVTKGGFGAFWQHTFEKSVAVVMSDATPTATIQSAVVLGLQQAAYFYPTGTIVNGQRTFTSAIDQKDRLVALVDMSGAITGWNYFGSDDSIENFNASGRLVSITPRSGATVTLGYDASQRVSTVVDAFGRALTFTYDSADRISRIADSLGGYYDYGYGVANNLISVTYPADALGVRPIKQYLFENASFPNLLTGIIDENGKRFATYSYDNQARAYQSWNLASPTQIVNQITYSYPSTTVTNVTDQLNTLRAYSYAAFNGVIHQTGVSLPCSSCGGASAQSLDYDTNGNVTAKTDFNGNKTCSAYDTTRNLETKRVEGVASGQTCDVNASVLPTDARKMETDWHATLRVPTERRIRNAGGALETKSQWTYNTRGQATARCEIDPTDTSGYVCSDTTAPPALAKVRRWVTTYCEQTDVTAGTCPRIGLVKSVNGPRATTDAGMGGLDDQTTYTYYQTDDATCASAGACPHRHGDLWKVTNALGQITENISYDKNGHVTRIKDSNGTYTDLVYHARGWLTDRIVRASATGTPGAGDATMHIDYDAVGQVTKVTQPDGAFLAYVYDDAHRLTDITDPLSNRIHYTLDAAGNRTKEDIYNSTYDPAHPAQGLKREVARVYNQLSQLTKVLNAASLPVERSDGLSATGVVDGYDGNGNRVLSLDGLGSGTKTEQDYDPLNRLKATIQNVGGAGTTANTTTGYTYDARDNLRQVTDPDLLNTVYDYDGLNNLTGLHSPDTGLTTYTPDAAGNRISQTDNRLQVSNYTYDALNRLTAIAYVGATGLNVGYAYDQADVTTGCSGSFPNGRLTTVTDASGSTSYCYDRRGNVTRKKQVTASVTLTTSYTYSVADRLATMTYPSGGVATYGRDTVGRITSVTWSNTAGSKASTIVAGATYYPFGPLNTLTFTGGRTLTKAYDQDYAIDSISGTPAGALTLDFGVDVMGNITNASSSLSPTTPDRSYAYDPLYRLMTAQTGASSPLESYTYNKTGDRMSAALNGGAAQIYAYTPSTGHRLTSVAGTARTYDLNGNTQTGTSTGLTLSYDARNRLSTAVQGSASAAYGYNGRGERVSKQYQPPLGQVTLTMYTYDEAGRLLGDYAAATSPQAEYVYLDSTPIAVIKAGVVYSIETDHLGTPRQVIDRARNVAVWKWDSLGNTFGVGAPNQDPDGDATQFVLNLRFPGQYFDGETGLDYNYFRDYEAGAGRYLESDPIDLKGGINTYSYVGSRPLRWTDRYGLIAETDRCAGLSPHQCMSLGGNPTVGWGANTTLPLPASIGGGQTMVQCDDECGKRHRFHYTKVCVGTPTEGLGVSIGGVTGMDGKNCKSKTYQGWFFEYSGTSAPFISFGGAQGYNEDGPHIPFTSHNLPGTTNGVTENSLAFGIFSPGISGNYCYYVLDAEE